MSTSLKPISTPLIDVKGDERVFLAGQTGSGKTTLARTLLINIDRLVIVDSKNGLHDWQAESWSPGARHKLATGADVRIRVVDDDQAVDAMEVAWAAGNTLVYIDEITLVIPVPQRVPQVVRQIWQQGRSRNVGGWGGSQRPVYVPRFFLSEATHFMIFRLVDIDDRKRLSGFAGKAVLNRPVDRFGFYHYNVKLDRLVYYKRLRA